MPTYTDFQTFCMYFTLPVRFTLLTLLFGFGLCSHELINFIFIYLNTILLMNHFRGFHSHKYNETNISMWIRNHLLNILITFFSFVQNDWTVYFSNLLLTKKKPTLILLILLIINNWHVHYLNFSEWNLVNINTLVL